MTTTEKETPDAPCGPREPEDQNAHRLDPDIEVYRHKLAKFKLAESKETELLQTLWNIMSNMVDIGHRVDTIQMFLPSIFGKSVQDSGKLLEVNDATTQEGTNEKDTEHA